MRCYYLNFTNYRFNNCQETLREKRNMHLITSWTCTHIDIIRQYTIVYLINYETVDKTWQDVEMLLREGSAILNEYCFIKFISDIDVHNRLLNGFWVFSTLLSQHQTLSNLSLNDILFMIMTSRFQLRNPIVFFTNYN
jgi:hypothetical protein